MPLWEKSWRCFASGKTKGSNCYGRQPGVHAIWLMFSALNNASVFLLLEPFFCTLTNSRWKEKDEEVKLLERSIEELESTLFALKSSFIQFEWILWPKCCSYSFCHAFWMLVHTHVGTELLLLCLLWQQLSQIFVHKHTYVD